MGLAVKLSRYASPASVKAVATLNKSLAGWDLGPQRLALWAIWIVVHGVRTVTGPIRDGSHLFVGIRESVREDDRGKVDLDQAGGRLFVLSVEDGGGIRSVSSAITFRRHMEGRLGVLRETSEKQLEEGIYVLSSCGTAIDFGTVIGVGVPNVDRLVEEEDIAV